MQKLYCYADETGQDTEGAFFLVAVLILNQKSRNRLREKLLEIEQSVGKQRARWAQNRPKVRTAYLERVLALKELRRNIFYSTYHETKEYLSLTAHSLIKAIQHRAKKKYRVTIEIDGFDDTELVQVRKILKTAKIRYHKLRGPRDESEVFIRLADSMAGFLRDYLEGEPYIQELYRKFQRGGIIEELP